VKESLKPLRIHFIHVGNMRNKGVQALLRSDVQAILHLLKTGVRFSVSTCDVPGTKRYFPDIEHVLSPLVDIPYEKADSYARLRGLKRKDVRYRIALAVYFSVMPVQILLSIMSAVFIKIRLNPFYRAELLRQMKDSDLVVSYSDENFKDSLFLLPSNFYWYLTWWSMLLSRTWDVLVASYLGRRVVMFPNSVGPFNTHVGRLLSRLALRRCSCILVRDSISYEMVNKLGRTCPVISTSDTSLLYDELRVREPVSHGRLIGVVPGFYSDVLSADRVTQYLAAHAEALDFVLDKYGFDAVFLSNYVSGFANDDLDVCRRIISRMKNKDRVKVVNVDTFEEFKKILGRCSLVVSSRMHSSVAAVLEEVPTVCIAYDQKQIGFFQQLELTECLVSMSELSTEGLLKKIIEVHDNTEELVRKMAYKIPLLQQNVRQAIETTLRANLEYNS
jgi:polysaccharide pyruvyl transferase WcaK-like protein